MILEIHEVIDVSIYWATGGLYLSVRYLDDTQVEREIKFCLTDNLPKGMIGLLKNTIREHFLLCNKDGHRYTPPRGMKIVISSNVPEHNGIIEILTPERTKELVLRQLEEEQAVANTDSKSST